MIIHLLSPIDKMQTMCGRDIEGIHVSKCEESTNCQTCLEINKNQL